MTDDERQAIVQKHFSPRTLQEWRLLSGGLFNTTYYLAFSDGLKVVLRLGPINRHLLMRFEENMMPAEAYVYSLCQAKNIPVSEVLFVDTEKDIVDRDFMCVRYIPGTPLSALELPEALKYRLYCEVGALTKQIHEITGPRFGRVSQILAGGGYSTWREAVLGEIEDWKTRAVPAALYTDQELAAIDAVFAKHGSLFDEIEEPRLMHADLWSGNVLIVGEGKDSHVAAIIDADRAIFGDIDFEFASQWMINDAFVEGYGRALLLDEKNATRRKLYALIYTLLDSYVWLCQYNNKEYSDNCHQNAIELVRQLSNS